MASKKSRSAALEAALAEELPFPAAARRLAAPHTDLSSDLFGHRIELQADEFGIVRPADPDAVRLADSLGLAVLRSADQETPAESVVEETVVEAAAESVAEEET